jgi:hypothetical protein
MINIFRKHPVENGHDGYFSHLIFALSIGLRLLVTAAFFLIHSVFPFIPTPKFLSLEKTTQYLIVKNHGTL